MSMKIFRGDATPIAQVSAATPANVEVGDVFTLTMGGKSVSYTAAAATVADVTAGLASGVNSSAIPEFSEIVATDEATRILLTTRTPGKPFAVTGDATDGGSADTQTLAISEITPSSGPEHWDTAANWTAGAVPADGDDVIIGHTNASIRYGLDQSGVTLASLSVAGVYEGEIGLPAVAVGENGAAYFQFRDRFLKIGADAALIGDGEGLGAARILLDLDAADAAITVEKTAQPLSGAAVTLQNTGAAATLSVERGSVATGQPGDEAASFATIRQTGGQLRIGAGATVDTLEISDQAQCELAADVTTLTQTGGELTVDGAAALGNVTITAGRLFHRASGDITDLTVAGETAQVSFRGNLASRTVGDATLTAGQISDPSQVVTWAGGVQPGKELRAA